MDYAKSGPHNVRSSLEDSTVKYAVWIYLIAVLCAAAGLQAASNAAGGHQMYRWVDDHGVVHYGDQIPPEYATRERDVVNSEGVVVERMDAQKSAEQIAADEKQKAAAQERHSRDQNLLNTYVSVQEIERLRDQRLALVSDQIKVTSQFLDVLTSRLAKLQASSRIFKPYSSNPNALRMPDQMAEDLVRTGTDIRTQQQNLLEKRNEEATMRAQFNGDIARFKELKGIH